MLDLVVWVRGAGPLGLGAVIRVATMPPGPAKHRRLASRDREQAFRGGTPAHAFPLGFVLCRSLRFLSGLARACWGISGDPAAALTGAHQEICTAAQEPLSPQRTHCRPRDASVLHRTGGGLESKGRTRYTS